MTIHDEASTAPRSTDPNEGRDDSATRRTISPSAESPKDGARAQVDWTPPESQPAAGVDPLAQRRVGRFALRRFLGRGAMGDVHLAYDPERREEIALKWVRVATADPEALEAERHGAELQRRVSEGAPLVAEVFEHGDVTEPGSGELFYVAMEFVDGVDLTDVLRSANGEPLPVERTLRIGIQLAEVLEILHAFETTIDGKSIARVIHGDIKPENIRIQEGDRVRILDFGVAKHLTLTRQATHNLFGSYPYTPPERLTSGLVNESSDLWAVGIILYVMASARQPYPGKTPEQLERLIRSAPPLPLPSTCHPRMRPVIERALAFDAANRYADATELREALKAVRETVGATDSAQTSSGGLATVVPMPGLEVARQPGDSSEPDDDDSSGESDTSGESETAVALVVDESTRRTGPPLPPAPGGSTRRTLPPPITADAAVMEAPGSTRRTQPPPAPGALGDHLPPPGTALDGPEGRLEMLRERWRQLPRRWRRWIVILLIGFVWAQIWAQGAVRDVVDEVTSEASPDLEWSLGRLQFAAALRPFDIGLGESKRVLRQGLVAGADRVLGSFREDTSTPRRGDWERARDYLGAALELSHRDSDSRAKLLFSQAHIDRIDARSLYGRSQREEAQRSWDRAIYGFQKAAELSPEWPDPYLGLARIYAYEVFDVELLEQSLQEALRRGHAWRDRERAQLADAHRTEGLRTWESAQELVGESGEQQLLYDARRHLEIAISMYEQILPFGNARQNRDVALEALGEVRERIRGVRRF